MKNYFQFAERNTSYKQESIAGVTTFLSMAYILAVNPTILSQAGMDKGAVFTATALSAIIGCLLIGLIANFPIGIAPSMGINAFFTFTVCMGMGIPWETALAGVFVAGVLFMILSLLKIREKIINVIPQDLKFAVAGGIGFFIAFVGLKNAGIVVANDATFVGIGNLASPPTLLAIVGFVLTIIFLIKGVKGGIFYGMVIATAIGVFTGIIDRPQGIIGKIPSIEPTFGVVFSHLGDIFSPTILVVIFTFLFVAFFDTAGSLIAVASQAGIMKNNRIPNAGRALFADSLSAVSGSILGTSTTATFVESSAGIAVGGRTGFTSIVIAACFVISMFFAPVLAIVTPEVTAGALIIVGAMMATQISQINWSNFAVVIPCFVIIIMMPLTYSVATGIALGFVLYPISMIAMKKTREVHPIMYVLCLTFVGYFAYAI